MTQGTMTTEEMRSRLALHPVDIELTGRDLVALSAILTAASAVTSSTVMCKICMGHLIMRKVIVSSDVAEVLDKILAATTEVVQSLKLEAQL